MPGGAGQVRAATNGQPPRGGPFNQRLGNPGGPSRFDGPSEGPNSPRPPMSPSRQQGGRPGTTGQQTAHPGNPAQNPFGPGIGYDPARITAPKKESVITNTRVELPSSAYQLDRSVSRQVFANFLFSIMML
jgi:eukaryotic translation initiation factor 2C